jgi:hypothetical protein
MIYTLFSSQEHVSGMILRSFVRSSANSKDSTDLNLSLCTVIVPVQTYKPIKPAETWESNAYEYQPTGEEKAEQQALDVTSSCLTFSSPTMYLASLKTWETPEVALATRCD